MANASTRQIASVDRYANALFQLAKEAKVLETVSSELLNLKKILLEVSQGNVTAERFYSRFDFSTVGIRKNYYKDGSHALLKEKKLTTK